MRKGLMIQSTSKSHPYISLEKHNEALLRYNRNFKENERLPATEREQIDEAILYHDYGKQNGYFQERIHKLETLKGNEKKKVKRDMRHDKHAVLSALKYMKDAPESLTSKRFLENVNIILGHHGTLTSFPALMDKMYRYIDDSDIQVSLHTIEMITDAELRSAFMVMEDLAFELEEQWSIEDAVHIRMQFSRLVDADRLAAMRKSMYNHEDLIERNFNREAYFYKSNLDSNDLKKHGEKTALQKLRDSILIDYQALDVSDSGVFSLIMPTGLGKTITAIDIAERNKNKVLYVVPFLSIVDQTYSVLKDIYKHRPYRGMWDFLARHDSRLQDKEYERDELDETISVKSMIESWRSKVIVTTSVQFFESLISIHSGKLRKLHNTYGATILIDEPQSIPHDKWGFLKEIVEETARVMKWKVIYMSATPPQFGDNVKPLVKNPEIIFKSLSRTRISYAGRTSGGKGIQKWTQEAFALTKDKNQILWVLNIERGARKIFDYAKHIVKDHKVIFISGKLPAIIRMYKLDYIKQCMANGEKILVISTQVLEAGVDLDFDGVVRDMAPLPVLLQVAGRLNRKGLRPTETMHVLQLFGESVYSDYEFFHTGNVLYTYGNTLEESDYYDACRHYFTLCDEMPPMETPVSWREQYISLQECSMQMIPDQSYQTNATCLSLSDWLYDKDTPKEVREGFMDYFKEMTGYSYRNVQDVLFDIVALEEKPRKRYEDYLQLKDFYNYIGWFDTNTNRKKVSKLAINNFEFQTMKLPLNLIGYE